MIANTVITRWNVLPAARSDEAGTTYLLSYGEPLGQPVTMTPRGLSIWVDIASHPEGASIDDLVESLETTDDIDRSTIAESLHEFIESLVSHRLVVRRDDGPER